MKYKRIEKKIDTIIQLLETIASRLPQEVAVDSPAAERPAPLEAVPPAPVPAAEAPEAGRDPLALLEDREEWRRLIEGWQEPAGFPQSPNK